MVVFESGLSVEIILEMVVFEFGLSVEIITRDGCLRIWVIS